MLFKGGKDMYDYKKIIPFGYYKKNPVYYDLNEGSLKVSQSKVIPYKINGWILSAVLVALSIIRKSYPLNSYVKMTLFVLATIVAVVAVKSVNRHQYNQLSLSPFYISNGEYREFLNQQLKNASLLFYFVIGVYIVLFISVILCIFQSSLLGFFLYVPVLFIVLLLRRSRVLYRKRIVFKLLEDLKNE